MYKLVIHSFYDVYFMALLPLLIVPERDFVVLWCLLFYLILCLRVFKDFSRLPLN